MLRQCCPLYLISRSLLILLSILSSCDVNHQLLQLSVVTLRWHGDDREIKALTLSLSSPSTLIFLAAGSNMAAILILVVASVYRAGGRDLVRVAEVGGKVELDCPEQRQNGGCTWEKQGRDGIACCYGINCQVAKKRKKKNL